jgi:hypothetical protein
MDLDREALEQGVAQQKLSGKARIVLRAPCDLTGLLDALPAPGRASSADVEKLLSLLHSPRPFNDSYDLVLSMGLLTQMFQLVEDTGLQSSDSLKLVLALRRHHLRTLFTLTRKGGAFVLATDVVSTTTAPELKDCSEASLGEQLARLVENRNFFTGANPAAIWKELTDDPEFETHTRDIESHDPWMWPLASTHAYLTWAVTVRVR